MDTKKCPVCDKSFKPRNCGNGLVSGFCSKKCNKKARKAGWKAARRAVLARDNGRCVECQSAEGIQVHHVVPFVNGGTHALSNLITLCHPCHVETHRKDAESCKA